MLKNKLLIDITGQKFGHLTAIEYLGHQKWLCKCDCDNETLVNAYSSNLKTGKQTNCGCIKYKKLSESKRKYNTYDLSGEYGIGYTLKGEEFYFDLDDYEKIKNYCWFLHDGYVATNGKNNEYIRMHRLIMNAMPNEIVDHKKHKTNDNRKKELRKVTLSQNAMNSDLMKSNTSGTTGITWTKDNQKWRARINKDNKQIHLGYFDNYEDAVNARNEAEEIYFKEYSYKNSLII